MRINGIKAMESISGRQTMKVLPVDMISKSLQNEITDVQRQKQELSSKEDISVEEKMKKRKELQQEIASLNMELRQRQAEIRRERQKETMSNEMREDMNSMKEAEMQAVQLDDADKKKTENIEVEFEDTKPSSEETKKMEEISTMDLSIQQKRHQGTIISRMEDGIVILKGEIRQDEARGVDVENKKAELAHKEKRLLQAFSFNTMYNTTEKTSKTAEPAKVDSGMYRKREEDRIINATNYTKERIQTVQY